MNGIQILGAVLWQPHVVVELCVFNDFAVFLEVTVLESYIILFISTTRIT
jgi:hypothetical protein